MAETAAPAGRIPAGDDAGRRGRQRSADRRFRCARAACRGRWFGRGRPGHRRAGPARLAGGRAALAPGAERRPGMKRIYLLGLALAGLSLPLAAHEGHDHDEKKPLVAPGNTPQRLPDGAVFLPKSAQRGMGVLTVKVAEESLPRTLELPGRMIMDPHVGGRVQAMIPGRIEAAGPHGLPAAGSKVKKGDILAWVVPASGAIERSNQSALQAELKASL